MSNEAFESVIGAMLGAIADAMTDEIAGVDGQDLSPESIIRGIGIRIGDLDPAPIAAELAAAVASSAPTMSTHGGLGDASAFDHDGRAAQWRVRLRLFDSFDDLQADTDPDSDLDAPGSDSVAGLPAVAAWAEQIAAAFHRDAGFNILWPGPAEIKHKLKSLRPTLSRAGGSAIWRIPYTVAGDGGWKAVISVSRAEEPSE